MVNRRFLIKFGGSILYDKQNRLNINLLKQFRDEILKLVERGYQIAVVIGGGRVTRNLVSDLKEESLSHTELDHLSIMMTQVHATILRMLFGNNAIKRDFSTYNELLEFSWESSKVLVIGGLFPGQSTNGTTAICSELLQVEYFFNLFGYDHISSNDPTNGNPRELLSNISYEELGRLIKNFKQMLGHYELFDHNALQFVKRSSIPVIFLNGMEPELISSYLNSNNIGTKVWRG